MVKQLERYYGKKPNQARQCAPHDRFLDVLIQKSIRRAGESKDALIRPASTSTPHKTLLRQRLPQMT